MLPKGPKLGLISFFGWLLMQFVGRTSRFTIKGYDRVKEMITNGQGFIFIIWHGRTMLPVYYCRNMGIQAIISLSRDGELQSRIFERFGFAVIRGSTGRGGVKAALTAVKRLREGGMLAITPDGPLGPANQVQDGTIFMAKKAGVPIIPVGVGISRRKLMPTWDSYALPRPFCRCGLVFGEPLTLPTGVDDAELKEMLKSALDSTEREARALVGEEH
jgi:lysophospholipid acyltransferase (LPLAT)-like uncharacterized protein